MARKPRYPLEFRPPDLRERADRAAKAEGRSLNNWINRLIQKEVAKMGDSVTISWEHEEYPQWDSTGTVADSWYGKHGEYACQIDRFTVEEGGGYAYTVSLDGNPLKDAENEAAESWEAAEEAILRRVRRHQPG
ncbi:MAG: hypothetical protein KGL39_20715 [Patescibacteria group bacterium]|nr:hypothetical protein [Patescibacteria group bacterium]